MTPDWPSIAASLVGAPFGWAARGPDRYDCWGIVLRAYEMAGHPCPGKWNPSVPAAAHAIMEDQTRNPRWLRVECPEPGDVVPMSTHSVIHHIGVYTPIGVLHTSRKLGAVISTLSELRLQGYRRIEYYRWVG